MRVDGRGVIVSGVVVGTGRLFRGCGFLGRIKVGSSGLVGKVDMLRSKGFFRTWGRGCLFRFRRLFFVGCLLIS